MNITLAPKSVELLRVARMVHQLSFGEILDEAMLLYEARCKPYDAARTMLGPKAPAPAASGEEPRP